MASVPLPPGPLLLHLETSTAVCSVALSAGPVPVSLSETYLPQLHSRVLIALVEQQLAHLGLPPAALAGVVVAAGPGSYTGLRVAASAAKGYCQALGLPLVAVPTLQALAQRVQAEAQRRGAHIRPLLDARRDEVYSARYDSSLTQAAPYAPHILTPTSFADELAAGPVLFVGDGAAKTARLLAPHPNAFYYPEVGTSAAGLVPLGYARFVAGETETLATFEPAYGKGVAVGPHPTQPTPPRG